MANSSLTKTLISCLSQLSSARTESLHIFDDLLNDSEVDFKGMPTMGSNEILHSILLENHLDATS
jgi:hypothetical protein